MNEFFFLQYVSLMIPLIYYKLKYILGTFYNKVYCIFQTAIKML